MTTVPATSAGPAVGVMNATLSGPDEAGDGCVGDGWSHPRANRAKATRPASRRFAERCGSIWRHGSNRSAGKSQGISRSFAGLEEKPSHDGHEEHEVTLGKNSQNDLRVLRVLR